MSSILNGAATSVYGLKDPGAFKLRRTIATVQGRKANVDPRVAEQLSYIDGLLTKAIYPANDQAKDLLLSLAGLSLTPRRSKDRKRDIGLFAKDSLGEKLNSHKTNDGELTLAEVLDANNELTDLRYGFDEELNDRWATLEYNTQVVLEYRGVRDFIIARATQLRGILHRSSLVNFALFHPEGAPDFIKYAAASAIREVVSEELLRVDSINDDASPELAATVEIASRFTVDSFAPNVRESLSQLLENSQYTELIKLSGTKNIPASLMPVLVQYIKSSHIPVTAENAPFMVPMYLAKAATSMGPAQPSLEADPFAVTFYGDDSTQATVNSGAVRCAAQLYYVMTLGDELGVFDTVRYLTQDYLFRDGFAIEDPVLRKDLEDYVFSNRFLHRDPRTGSEDKIDCTREPVRKAYYRQVFDSGTAPTIADTPPNREFRRLWKILMLESARFLERAQLSPHPDNYVSRQNVMQAVEDLQNNLSTTCVGLATVATPMINAELDFVITHILNHPEVRRHLVPTGGSWLKLVDKMAAAQGRRSKSSALNNKARIGHALLMAVADFSPAAFEQDEPFSRFLSNVDAFITTFSILEAPDLDEEEQSAVPGNPEFPGMVSVPPLQDLPGMPAGISGLNPLAGSPTNGVSTPANDWNF